MGRGVFRKVIKNGGASRLTEGAVDAENGTAKKNAGSPLGSDGNSQKPTAHADADSGQPTRRNGDDPSAPAGSAGRQHSDAVARPQIYGDVEVCRYLRIRRRKLAEARTKQTRGIDWDCVGLHAGMTLKWIHEEAVRLGIVPDFAGAPLHPIAEGDGVVSCRLIGTWPNRSKVTVEVVATGEVKVATVRDAAEFHLYEIFDARDYGREIAWCAELNSATY